MLVDEIEARFLENIQERCPIPEGETLVVAVSGGLDSMVLLRLLAKLAPREKWRLIVAHFNHRLRGRESDLDQAFVERAAGKIGLVCHADAGDVRRYAREHGLSTEMGARELRHRFLAKIARAHSASRVVLAHHADDQVETCILRFLRGSGLEGIRGMRPEAQSPANRSVLLVRPLLDFPRAILADYAKRNRIRFRHDSSNSSSDVARNYLRRCVLPLIQRRLQPALRQTVMRAANLAGSEAEFVTEAARRWRARRKCIPFDNLHVAVQRRVIQIELRELGLTERFDLVEALRQTPNRPVMTEHGARVWRDSRGRVLSGAAHTSGFDRTRSVVTLSEMAGETIFDGVTIRWRVRRSTGTHRRRRSMPGLECFDADKVGTDVLLRHWQPGDRFQPIGMRHSVKLQDLFVNAKVPHPERHSRIVAEAMSGIIFWVEGLRIGEAFKRGADTLRALDWAWHRSGSDSRIMPSLACWLSTVAGPASQ